MDAIRRTSTLRRVATTASLAALLLTPGAADAKKAKPKSPVITSVSPMSAVVGQTLTIRGRNFVKGKGKNSVGFKRDGEAVVFVKAGVSTTKIMTVKIPDRLAKVLKGTPASFHLRILAKRFGKTYTPTKLSPLIAPKPAGPPAPGADSPTPTATAAPTVTVAPTAPTCVAKNNDDGADSDGDGLSDKFENDVSGTSGCDADSDDDNVPDGYEYRAAIDLNDDEYQQDPNSILPFPGARPYPNALDKDSDKDYDGDGLSMSVEYSLTKKYETTTPPLLTVANATATPTPGGPATPLLYSDGLKYSQSRYCKADETTGYCSNAQHNQQNRRIPTLAAIGYVKWDGVKGVNGATEDGFYTWAKNNGYGEVDIHNPMRYIGTPSSDPKCPWYDHANCRMLVDIRNVNLKNGVEPSEMDPDDLDGDGFLSDDERDEDADGLTNYAEFVGYMQPAYWEGCYTKEKPYSIAYAGTNPIVQDSDGDGVRDGADDQDHDDIPNLMEQSRIKASGLDDRNGADCKVSDTLPDTIHPNAYGRVNPFNPCLPDIGSRGCPTVVGDFAPFDGSPNWWSLQ